jgi:arylsulfatase A-like enzyme
LQELRRRGLLDDTLVLWGGEFGRLPINELTTDKEAGNDGWGHGPHGFTTWMAGGGVKGGVTYGATDEIGFAAVEDKVSVNDWHATILHLLGLDPEKLLFDRNGFEEKLTSTFSVRVVTEVLV